MNTRLERGAIILTGGDNQRMKRDKARLPLGSTTFIEHICNNLGPHFAEIIISSSQAGKLPELPYPIIRDERHGLGPLMGIASALRRATYPDNFVIACDIPELDVKLIEKLFLYNVENDVVVPVNADGQFEPLYAIYNKRVIPVIDQMLESGNRKVIDLFRRVKTKTVAVENPDWPVNINTPDDYLSYVKRRSVIKKS